VLLSVASGAADPQHCPPGHAQKGWCSPGSIRSLPPGIRMQVWEGWRERGLRAPSRGEAWVVADGEAYLIIEATRQVLEAVGAVSRAVN
jgi:Ni/Co efflux regulator RcnB